MIEKVWRDWVRDTVLKVTLASRRRMSLISALRTKGTTRVDAHFAATCAIPQNTQFCVSCFNMSMYILWALPRNRAQNKGEYSGHSLHGMMIHWYMHQCSCTKSATATWGHDTRNQPQRQPNKDPELGVVLANSILIWLMFAHGFRDLCSWPVRISSIASHEPS